MTDLEKVCSDLERLANSFKVAVDNRQYATVTSLVFVRKMEEYKPFIKEESYNRLILFHDESFKQYNLRYGEILLRQFNK